MKKILFISFILLCSISMQAQDRKKVRLVTTEGDIVVELYNETPIHRDNFLKLAETGALDSTLFHRVIKNFMIQGGGPDRENEPPALKAEILYPQFLHKRGALAAAREGDDVNPEKKSSSLQFYIVWGTWPASSGRHPYVPKNEYYADKPGTPWLDGGYTVFGEVVEGLPVVGNIQKMDTDANDRPIKDVRLLRMEVLK